jgi:hypothetical protein
LEVSIEEEIRSIPETAFIPTRYTISNIRKPNPCSIQDFQGTGGKPGFQREGNMRGESGW